MEEIYTPEEAAELLKIQPRTLRGWLRERRIGGVKVGREWRLREQDLIRYLNHNATGPQGPGPAPTGAGPGE
jgi:excisionase family DNA binding protein